MIEYIKKRINNKNVLILGFGREGQSTLKTFLEAGSAKNITIADQKVLSLESDVFADEAYADYDLHALKFFCGPQYQDSCDDYDLVMKSPGIVLKKEISMYQTEILSQMQLFFEFYRDRIIGITGTKGKSTTTTLLYHILKESGRPAILAGNIGIPVFDILHEITDESIPVIELSCHQLEYMTMSPKWGILLNIYEEHLDHYGTLDKYIASKEKIYENQKDGDYLFVNPDVRPENGRCRANVKTVDIKNCNAGLDEGTDIVLYMPLDSEQMPPTIVYKNRQCKIPTTKISLLGAHNYLDIAYVYGVCCEFGISDEEFIKGLKSYVPLPHRLQYIGTVDGVAYYDDSISTIDETTIQALNTIKNADTVLIGGMDRGISYVNLERYLAESNVAHIILMEDTGKRIYEEIQADYPDFLHKERLYVVDHLKDAVELAKQITKKGGSCILSPAAASYGIFKNFEERGEVFANLVNQNQ
ncbi:MAG: UDP-N-acetylmuramoyl-L-alanine--D-glutamate ligase [Lachnospiraceae bacterium]|nr:UDP-N-acetylmuramoyl-L-alanine--D-glutamate ligase [Lachnospiraceae bacterium]